MPLATETPEPANKTSATTGESCTTEKKIFKALNEKIFLEEKQFYSIT